VPKSGLQGRMAFSRGSRYVLALLATALLLIGCGREPFYADPTGEQVPTGEDFGSPTESPAEPRGPAPEDPVQGHPDEAEPRDPSPAPAAPEGDASGAICPVGVRSGTLVLEVKGACVALPVQLGEDVRSPTRVVIGIHGRERNHASMYRSLERALPEVQTDAVLLIAPKFYSDAGDDPPDALEAAYWPVWHGNRWTEGDESLPFGEPSQTVSSYEVLDALASWVLEAYGAEGALKEIVVYGHSAGGQFVNRYAAGSPVPELAEEHGIRTLFVVANPSSYLYFDARRPAPDDMTVLRVPSEEQIADCPEFDRYKYGLERRNSYMSALPTDAIRDLYLARNVVHLVGSEDDDPDDPDLAKDCAAAMQGRDRLERALAYHNYRYAIGGSPSHYTAVVTGAGHSSADITTSACGRAFLFEGVPTGDCLTLEQAVVSTDDVRVRRAASFEWSAVKATAEGALPEPWVH
jgi:pimeloyl-ACP methyl ester carboxylesterase